MLWRSRLVMREGSVVHAFSLSGCTWKEGRLAQMTIWKWGFLLSGRALILELPKEITRQEGVGDRMAVGFTPQSYELWKSFFILADIPQTSR